MILFKPWMLISEAMVRCHLDRQDAANVAKSFGLSPGEAAQ